MKVAPVTLEGAHVRLEPLTMEHAPALWEAGSDPEVWRLIPSRVTSREEMMAFVQSVLAAQAAGTALPFATIHRESGRAIGSTRYMNIDAASRRLEIGGTWIAPEFQRSPVNTEAKLLMLRHAFEALGAMRVELKTDSLNYRSRNAIQRIGARPEGIFRNHMPTWSGRIRHSAYFSITDAEWPEVRKNLEAKLAGGSSSGPRRVYTLNEAQIDDLHRLFQNEWWTRDRAREDVRRMLDNTPVIVAFAEAKTDRLIAFARALTDGVYKALILDVVVETEARKTGLGKRLIDEALAHPLVSGVRHFELYCRPELIPFYARCSFEPAGPDLVLLRRSV